VGTKNKGKVVALDLGNATTLVATIDKDGHVQCIPDPDGLEHTPTAVAYEGGDPDRPLYGRSAHSYRKMDPENVCVFAKRARGRKDSIGIVDKNGQPSSAAQLEARLVAWRLGHAAEYTGEPIVGVLPTVPAAFDDAQRRATQEIIELAGFPCIGTVNEPTAALLGYAKGRHGVFAVSDLGGGTYDVTILKSEKGNVFTVLATSGQDDLGGREYTARLIDHCMAYAIGQGVDLDPAVDFLDMVRLEQACEDAKVELSTQRSAFISFRAKDRLLDLEVTAEQFEDITSSLGNQIFNHMTTALEHAGLRTADISGVVFAGGGSRVPGSRRPIEQLFGADKILRDIDVDKAVVLGACRAIGLKIEERRQAGDMKLVGKVPAYFLAGDVSIREIVGQALGVDALNMTNQQQTLVPIIEQGAALPASASKIFGMLNGDKDQFETYISVLQGEAYSLASAAHVLGKFPLSDLPAGPSEDRIEITFRVDTNGLVDLHAIDKHSGKEIKRQVDAAGAVTKNQLS